jgi:hypothetical protein
LIVRIAEITTSMKEKTRKKRAVAVPDQKEAGPQTFTSARGVRFGILIILVAINLAIFAPVRNHDFVNFDDPDYVTDNSVVKQGLTLDGVAWAFTTPHAANWHPLTWLSHMLDIEDRGNVLTEQGKFDEALKEYGRHFGSIRDSYKLTSISVSFWGFRTKLMKP